MNKRQKKKQIRMKNKKIVKRYPWLLPRNVWSDEVPEDYDYSYSLADCFPKGWRKSFFEEMHEEIREELIRCNYLNEFRVMQIKEKYAQLRYYTGSIPKNCNVYEIIHKYEHISQYICIDCGKCDVPVIDDGWLTPICKNCYDKRQRFHSNQYKKIGIDYKFDPLRYEKLLENIDYDYTLKDYYTVTTRQPGGEWEDIKIDISELVERLRKRC